VTEEDSKVVKEKERENPKTRRKTVIRIGRIKVKPRDTRI